MGLIKNKGIKNYLLSAQNNDSLIDLIDFYNISHFFEKISGTNNFHARGKALLASNLLKSIGGKNSEILFSVFVFLLLNLRPLNIIILDYMSTFPSISFGIFSPIIFKIVGAISASFPFLSFL